ncbi:hypothetical protein BVRB_2g029060 [Beta vulgaris subsp. vulgaris]|nr:hypothetical protein BVRB_2g029060 [Beta vulgaris subsp. vulgaris]
MLTMIKFGSAVTRVSALAQLGKSFPIYPSICSIFRLGGGWRSSNSSWC